MTKHDTYIAGPKRHAEFFFGDDGAEIVERTETGLGGFFVDPPAMAGRAPGGCRIWSLEAVRREVAYALAAGMTRRPYAPRPCSANGGGFSGRTQLPKKSVTIRDRFARCSGSFPRFFSTS